MSVGVLLINLGTPESPRVPEVRKYLAEFLMDPWVIDIPAPLRWLLVHGAILPTRPAKSAEAYAQIWTERGSPLMFHTMDLAERVRERLGAGYVVRAAMRYGQPSIEKGLRELKDAGVEKVRVLPLYPQYSLSATRTAIDATLRASRRVGFTAPMQILPDFFGDRGFLRAFTEVARPVLGDFKPDHVLFSFHGLPERHVRKTDATGKHCFSSGACCDRVGESNRQCYRAQSFHTARELARELGLGAGGWQVSFQSRLGRTPWIKPYTDLLYEPLVQQGVKRLAVMCPAFVADCLETLEEIQIRGREQFRAAGGEELRLVPSLNSSPAWVEAVCGMVKA
jgi:ferrochelatase